MQHCTTQITVKPTQLQVYHLTTLIHCIKHNTLYGMYYLVSLKIRFLTACQLNLAETSINWLIIEWKIYELVAASVLADSVGKLVTYRVVLSLMETSLFFIVLKGWGLLFTCSPSVCRLCNTDYSQDGHSMGSNTSLKPHKNAQQLTVSVLAHPCCHADRAVQQARCCCCSG